MCTPHYQSLRYRRRHDVKTIIVTVEVDVPDNATDKDITDFVDVEFGQCGGMKMDNVCRGNATEVIHAAWKHE